MKSLTVNQAANAEKNASARKVKSGDSGGPSEGRVNLGASWVGFIVCYALRVRRWISWSRKSIRAWRCEPPSGQ